MGDDEDEELEGADEEREGVPAGPPVDVDDGGPIPQPDADPTPGYEGSIEGF